MGAGSLGGTVGGLSVEAGHEVLFSSRHPEDLVRMAKELGPRSGHTPAPEFDKPEYPWGGSPPVFTRVSVGPGPKIPSTRFSLIWLRLRTNM
ncbi:MAG TPA: hypothetical protein VMK12_13000 [Anaeromyxobacteraceae bacterium]|nr:hypothetical protein [Anaeromyxobacteraceae bacterium]